MWYQLIAYTGVEIFTWDLDEELAATTEFMLWLGWMNMHDNNFRPFGPLADDMTLLKPARIKELQLRIVVDQL